MFITNSRSFISVYTEIKPLLKELKSGASQVTKWGTPVEKWKHNQTPNTTHSLKVVRLFNINENSSLVPVKVNTDKTSLDYILLPCFKSTKPGFTGKSFFICAPVRCFGDELGEQLLVRPYLPTSAPGLTNALVAEREQIPAAGLQNPVERLKKKKLETSDFSRKCSIITSRCCVQVWNQRSDMWWFICILLYF